MWRNIGDDIALAVFRMLCLKLTFIPATFNFSSTVVYGVLYNVHVWLEINITSQMFYN